VQLDVTAAHPDRVLEPAPRGGEGLAHGDGHIIVMLMVDGDLAAGHLQINAHHELAALRGVPARLLDDDAAADEVGVEALEPCRALAHGLFQGGGVRQVSQRDLNGKVHDPSLCASRGVHLIYVNEGAVPLVRTA